MLSSERNLGAAGNFVRTYEACQGEYVATLDGDDYWTSTDKLQKQVDFLGSHPECAFCFHAVKRTFEGDQSSHTLYPPGRKILYTLEDYAEGNLGAPFCSTMFRNKLMSKIPKWFYSALAGDWAWQVLHATYGSMGYIDEVMGVHRCHARGMGYAARKHYGESLQVHIKTCRLLVSNVSRSIFNRYLYKLYYNLAHYLVERGDVRKAQYYAKKCLT